MWDEIDYTFLNFNDDYLYIYIIFIRNQYT